MRSHRRRALTLLALILVGACARSSSPGGTGPAKATRAEAPTSCEKVAPGCHVKRLPDVVLRNGATDGALRSVHGPIEDIISFDEALAAAWKEDGHPDARTVQVELGSADAKALHWDRECDSACDLFYAVDWTGVCIPVPGPMGASFPPCYEMTWGSVLDAHTGKFIVGGNG